VEEAHTKAQRPQRDEGEPKLTNNYIFVEFMALAHSRKLPRGLALSFIADLIGHPDIEVTWVDATRHEAGPRREKTALKHPRDHLPLDECRDNQVDHQDKQPDIGLGPAPEVPRVRWGTKSRLDFAVKEFRFLAAVVEP